MSQNNTSILYVGLDVAKLSLELHLADQFHSLANDATGPAPTLFVKPPAATNNPSCAHRRRPKKVSIIEAEARVRYHAGPRGQRD